jgi:hypothetical protein
MGMNPQVWLGVGDTLRLSIDGLGEQDARTIAATRPANTAFQTLGPARKS